MTGIDHTADWITAIGTAAGGAAAVAALAFGAWQFRRGGIVYRVRASLDQDKRIIRVAVANTGRTTGQIAYVEALNRGSFWRRLGRGLIGQLGTFAAVDAILWPADSGPRNTTLSTPANSSAALATEVAPGHSFSAYLVRDAGSSDRLEHRPFAGQSIKRRRWLLVRVRFGDGRVADVIPRSVKGLYRLV